MPTMYVLLDTSVAVSMVWSDQRKYAMAEFVYQMYQARKAVGDKVILNDVTVGVYPGAKIGVVGPNGMGKSTLLKVIAGLETLSMEKPV